MIWYLIHDLLYAISFVRWHVIWYQWMSKGEDSKMIVMPKIKKEEECESKKRKKNVRVQKKKSVSMCES